MKTKIFNFTRAVLTLGTCAAFLVGGCTKSVQQKAYEQAAQKEQQLSAESAAAIIADYKRLIALEPDSEWARKAQAHIAALEAKMKAEELHKSVFQEHGVD